MRMILKFCAMALFWIIFFGISGLVAALGAALGSVLDKKNDNNDDGMAS